MRRVTYHLTEPQYAALLAESKRTGLTVAEIIRRAIDRHLEEQEKKAKGGKG